MRLLSNPIINGQIQLENKEGLKWRIEVFNINGQCLNQSIYRGRLISIASDGWPKGMYFVNAIQPGASTDKEVVSTTFRVIIN